MATSLQSFQNDIEQIHNREILKQRAHGAELAQKEQKNTKGKGKEEVPADKQSPSKGKAKEEAVVELTSAGTEEHRDNVETEEKVLVRPAIHPKIYLNWTIGALAVKSSSQP